MKKSLFALSASEWWSSGKKAQAKASGPLGPDVATVVLNALGVGVAVFAYSDRRLLWCNTLFRKQTWFGVAPGGRKAKSVSLFDLFPEADHGYVSELVRCTAELGFAQDDRRELLRGPTRSFAAQIKFHHIGVPFGDQKVFCLEFLDLSKVRSAGASNDTGAEETMAPRARPRGIAS